MERSHSQTAGMLDTMLQNWCSRTVTMLARDGGCHTITAAVLGSGGVQPHHLHTPLIMLALRLATVVGQVGKTKRWDVGSSTETATSTTDAASVKLPDALLDADRYIRAALADGIGNSESNVFGKQGLCSTRLAGCC
jgi:hypothetical protein